jgi:hypothetical protein
LFFTYEGYRESAFQRINDTVPTQKLKNEILQALPFPETKILMDTLPEPVVPLDDDRGRFEGAGLREMKENHFVMKGDILNLMTQGGSLTMAYTRNRPFGLEPRINLNGANDRTYDYLQDRLSLQYVLSRAQWVSETRFGYNHADMERLDHFFTFKDPKTSERIEWQRRVPRLGILGIGTWGSAEVWQMDGTTYSLDQKMGRHMGKHLFKFGGRYAAAGRTLRILSTNSTARQIWLPMLPAR